MPTNTDLLIGLIIKYVLIIGRAHFMNAKYDEALKRLTPLLYSNIDRKMVAMVRLITGQIYQKRNNHKKGGNHQQNDNSRKQHPKTETNRHGNDVFSRG